MINLVELWEDDENMSETPCAYGNLVEGHSVYCHNDGWAEGPRKCRRTWYYGEPDKYDETCEGFKANPSFPGGSEQWIELRRKPKQPTPTPSQAPEKP